MKPLLRWLALALLALLALQLLFVGRIAAMAVLNPESTAFQRSEAWAQIAGPDRLRWHQQWVAYADISDLQRDFGITINTPIEEGLASFVAWYRSYYNV